MRGRVLVAIIVLLCLMGMDFIDPGAIAREVVSQYRSRMAMYPTVLTVEQEKAKAKPSLSKTEGVTAQPTRVTPSRSTDRPSVRSVIW